MANSIAHRARASSVETSLTRYLHEIRDYRLLTRGEEVALARRIRRGDSDALSALVCANLRFVVAVAKHFQNRGVPLEDLIDEGNLGLIRAAEKFDEAKGVKFITYAVWWIRQSIHQAIIEQGQTIRVPLSRARVLQGIRRRATVLRHELGREPTRRELANDMTIDDEALDAALPLAGSVVSLDGSQSSGDDVKLMDYLTDERAPAPDERASEDSLTSSVSKALASLTPRQARVLSLYFGLDGSEPMTLNEIGQALGVTRERTRQIKEKALWRLRNSPYARTLGSFSGQDVQSAPPAAKAAQEFGVSRIAGDRTDRHISLAFTGRESVDGAFPRDVVGRQRISNSV